MPECLPLRIWCLEDKIVQQAVVTVLNAIYEEDFVGFSYGFRPGRSQHDALDALHAGIVEDGRVTRSERGAPQGAVISPILANVYLHYVYDLWVHRWRRTKASGDMIIIRYADDTIFRFQHKHEAKAFLDDLKERMRAFELALNPDKTRMLRFGRRAVKQREMRGEGKPETFDFLGFTHFCTRSRRTGSFVIGRKTTKKRMVRRLQTAKMELRKRMHDSIAWTGAWVRQMLRGHLNYYAVPGNEPSLRWFVAEVRWRWLKILKRRSQHMLSIGMSSPA